MYICQGHFLAPYVIVIKDDQPLGRLVSIDTELMVAQRLVGYQQDTGESITDLVKVDKVFFSTTIPANLKDLLPKGATLVTLKNE